jgi:hypothetical protein
MASKSWSGSTVVLCDKVRGSSTIDEFNEATVSFAEGPVGVTGSSTLRASKLKRLGELVSEDRRDE